MIRKNHLELLIGISCVFPITLLTKKQIIYETDFSVRCEKLCMRKGRVPFSEMLEAEWRTLSGKGSTSKDRTLDTAVRKPPFSSFLADKRQTGLQPLLQALTLHLHRCFLAAGRFWKCPKYQEVSSAGLGHLRLHVSLRESSASQCYLQQNRAQTEPGECL